jgi:hypothetical protein
MRGRGGRLQGEMVVHGEQHKKTHRRRQLSPHRVTARKDTALPQSVPVQGRTLSKNAGKNVHTHDTGQGEDGHTMASSSAPSASGDESKSRSMISRPRARASETNASNLGRFLAAIYNPHRTRRPLWPSPPKPPGCMGAAPVRNRQVCQPVSPFLSTYYYFKIPYLYCRSIFQSLPASLHQAACGV